MSARQALTVAAVALLVGMLYLYGITFIRTLPLGDPLGPKVFPIMLGIGMLLAGALLAFEAWRKVTPKPSRMVTASAKAGTAPDTGGISLTVVGVTIWTALYFWSFEPLGYIVSSTLYLFPLAYVFNGRKFLANGLTALLFSLISYLMFTKLLGVRLPSGLLPF